MTENKVDFLSLVKTRVEPGHAESTSQKKEKPKAKGSKSVSASLPPAKMSSQHLTDYAQALIINQFEPVAAYQELYPEASLKVAQKRAAELVESPELLDTMKDMYSVVSDSDEENKRYFARLFYNFISADITDYYEWRETVTYERYPNGRLKKKNGKRIEKVEGELVLKDITKLPKHMRQNIKSIEVAPGRNGRMRTKLILYDRQKAVSMAAKFAGVFDEFSPMGGAGSIDDFTRILEEAASRAEKARLKDIGGSTIDGDFE